MSVHRAAVGWTTTSTREEADELSEKLVTAGLIACAQVSAPIESHYQWQGKTMRETEYRITLKFSARRAGEIESWLNANHSYEVPQWLWVYADGGSADYLQWIQQQ